MFFIENLNMHIIHIMFYDLRPEEESLSDWSSDSCGWSDDDMGTDLGIMPSPLSCSSIASTTGSRENVRCVCDVEEENDFMLQVSTPLTQLVKHLVG